MSAYQAELRARLREGYQDKKILILGFGREGQTSYHFLRRLLPKQHLYLMDAQPIDPKLPIFCLDEMAKEYDQNLSFLSGESYLKDLAGYDIIFKTPGLPAALLGDTPVEKITSQTNELVAAIGQRVIGITGTKGKSTTSSLVYESLKAMGREVLLVGNIGKPALELLLEDSPERLYVYEMSSHQTQFLRHSPRIAVVLNLFEEHLDNYLDYQDYIEAKLRIGRELFENPELPGLFIYGCDNAKLMEYQNRWQACHHLGFGHFRNEREAGIYLRDNQIIWLSPEGQIELLLEKNFKRHLLGEHNLVNALVSFLAVQELEGLDSHKIEEIKKVISDFKGLEHRLEYVGKYQAIDFYNDSISTIPAATMQAIASIYNMQTLIIGGFDRGIDYQVLVKGLNRYPDLHLICLPDTGHKIFDSLCHSHKFWARNMQEAVEFAFGTTAPGRACALSPAAASYSFYKNFEERGSDFKQKVRAFSSKEMI